MTYTGKPIERIEAVDKVTGKAVYATETPVANVAHAVIVGSAIARGRITGVDARAAETSPGVLAVITHQNAPRLPGVAKLGKGNGRGVQVLQEDAVLYADQPVALVVADTLERARHAAALVELRYAAETPAVTIEPELERAYAPPAPPGRPPPDSNRGDVDAGMAAAAHKVDATYTTPIHHHNPMETHGSIAVWPGADRLTIYDSTQGIFEVRQRVADAFGLPKENVRVLGRYCGGGFGSKGSPWSHVFLAALAAKVAGRAVKLSITRPQMFAFVGHRPRTIQRVQLGAARDGTLTAVQHDLTAYTSRFDDFTELAAGGARYLHACPNVRTSHRLVRLDVATPTFTRAPGHASGSFAYESALDELAYAIKMDPLALRLKNHADADLDEGKPWSSKELRECYRQGAEKFGWARRKPAPGSMRDGRWSLGWGVATATYPARLSPASASAKIKADGTALVLSGSQEIGTGTWTIMTQIAADALGLPIEKVRFDLGDTGFPESPMSVGSRTAASVGSAVKRACDAARAQIVALAIADETSPLHGAAPEKVGIEAGKLFVAGGDRRRVDEVAAVLKRAGRDSLEAKIDHKEDEGRKKFSTHAFGAHFIEVRVDPELGIVRVARVVSAMAGGTILNARTARAQIWGGVVWGIGMALSEESVRDARNGRVVTRDLADYHVAVNADVPAIDVILVPEKDEIVSAVGAKGLGEIGIVGVSAAIANAVFHATGKRIRDLPITVDKLV